MPGCLSGRVGPHLILDDRAAEAQATPGLCGRPDLHEPLRRATEAPTGQPSQTAGVGMLLLPLGQVARPARQPLKARCHSASSSHSAGYP